MVVAPAALHNRCMAVRRVDVDATDNTGYSRGTLVPAIATASFNISGVGSAPGI
jgi:hypothetical protein